MTDEVKILRAGLDRVKKLANASMENFRDIARETIAKADAILDIEAELTYNGAVVHDEFVKTMAEEQEGEHAQTPDTPTSGRVISEEMLNWILSSLGSLKDNIPNYIRKDVQKSWATEIDVKVTALLASPSTAPKAPVKGESHE